MAAIDFNGQWKLDRNDENFEKFIQEMGINFFVRKVMLVVYPTTIIKQDGDKFEIKMHAGPINQVTTFTVGEECDFVYPWDKKAEKVKSEWEDGKLVTRPTVKEDLAVVTREIKDGEMVLTLQKGDLVTVRYFKKIDS